MNWLALFGEVTSEIAEEPFEEVVNSPDQTMPPVGNGIYMVKIHTYIEELESNEIHVAEIIFRGIVGGKEYPWTSLQTRSVGNIWRYQRTTMD